MLKKIRQKPDHVKASISLGLSLAIFSVIVLVWVSSFQARGQGAIVKEKTVSPLAGMFSVLRGFTADIKQSYQEITPADFLEPREESTLPVAWDPFDTEGMVIVDTTVPPQGE